MFTNKTWNTLHWLSIASMIINNYLWNNFADVISLILAFTSFILMIITLWKIQPKTNPKTQTTTKNKNQTN